MPDASTAAKPLFGLSRDDRYSLIVTTIMTAVTVVLLWYYASIGSITGIALSAGAFGGFLHEFVQSKGTILFIQRKDDGLYLGSISGLILGMVAGILILNTLVVTGPSGGKPDQTSLLYESLIAGLALKGVAEAATSAPVSSDDFAISGVSFSPNAATISLKNNMRLNTLQVQSVVIKDQRGQMLPCTSVATTVDPKSVGSVQVKDFSYTAGTNYTFTVVTLNGQGVQQVTAPSAT